MSRVILVILFLVSSLVSYSQINLLSWNIYMRPSWLFHNNQLDRSYLIRDYISKYDIVLLQEAFDKKSQKIIKSDFKYVILPEKNKNFISSGLMILSNIKIDFYETIYFDSCCGFDCLASKGATLIQVTKNSYTYQIISTHLQSDDGIKEDIIRKSQVLQILDLMNKYKIDSIPQILIGDLNQSVNSVYLFSECLNLNNCNLNGFSWKSKQNKTKLIDYVLLNYDNALFNIDNNIELSDHYPLSLILR